MSEVKLMITWLIRLSLAKTFYF